MTPMPTWNSLEIVKLVVAALTPLAVAILGWWISRQLKRLEHLQWANQKAVEKRLEVYSTLAPVLNDLYCYFHFIGDWKMKNPIEVLRVKRVADKLFHVNAALFSPNFRSAYNEFIDLCFVPGPLHEYESSAKLKTDIKIRRDMFTKLGQVWKPEWDAYFAPPNCLTSRDAIVRGYWKMMDSFVQELGVGLTENTQKKTHSDGKASGSKSSAAGKWYNSKVALVVWGAFFTLLGGAALAYFQGWLAPRTLSVTLNQPKIDSNVALKDFLKQTGNPTTDYTVEQLAQVGYTVHFQVQLVGYKGRTCRVRWELFDAASKSKVKLTGWHELQDPVDILSEADIDSASAKFWVPPFPSDQPFFVRISVDDDLGTELTYVETEIFTPGRSLTSSPQVSPANKAITSSPGG